MRSELNVLHVIPGVSPRYGGPSAAICSAVAALNSETNARSRIVCTDADGPHRRLSSSDIPPGVRVQMFRRTCSERWKFSWGLWNWLRRNVRDFNLLHLHAIWSFSTVAAARAAHRKGIPYIVRPAGMLSEYTWQRNGRLKRYYWNAVERITLENAAALHATSDAEAAEIRNVCPKARTYTIPNGVDEAAFGVSEDASLLRKLCGQHAADLPIALYFSRLHPKKGIVDRLLPAIAQLKTPCVLALAGGSDPHAPAHEQEVRNAIDKYHLSKRVIMLGHVAGDQRWAMYDSADLFVLPSHSENFGIVVAEAMARGCPVVVTEAVQSCTHVRAAGAGEVVSGDVDELAATIDRLLAQPELRTAYGEAGRRYAYEHFRWEQIAKQIYAMYCDCLNRG